jgi:protein-tyrosine phosphatase
VRILYVCTANICRSASAQRLLLDAVAAAPALSGIEVRSAGTDARPGSPGCSMAPALAGDAAGHRSQALSAELIAWADLILPAARDHRPSIVALEPASRTRTFTLRQAGRIADWIVDSGIVAAGRERSAAGEDPAAWAERFPAGDPRRNVQVLPDDLADRWVWVVGEMDAARGLAGVPLSPDRATAASTGTAATATATAAATGATASATAASTGASASAKATATASASADPRKRWRLGRDRGSVHGPHAPHQPGPSGSGRSSAERVAIDPSDLKADDVPDPHYLGAGLHPMAYEQILGSTNALVRLLREVAAAG